jgi:ATP-independent RNA helicase DbpA
VDEAGWAFSLASLDEMGRVGAIEKALDFTSVWQPLESLTRLDWIDPSNEWANAHETDPGQCRGR